MTAQSEGPFSERGPDFQQTFQFVPLDQLQESKSNPRRHFDKKGLEELAESIQRQGVLSPLLVRFLGFAAAKAGAYEVVCGARRYRAAKLAGVSEVPVRVVELTDDQVLELQVVENLQREGVHPMDEALGYEALQKRGYSAAAIAAKVGKSVSYVNARLRFTSLGAVGRDAFLEGKLSPSVALLVARVPHAELQAKAVKEIVGAGHGRQAEHAPTVFEVRRLLQAGYMRSLKDCQFPKASATLLPAAGPCTTCPKRTGSQRELFDDVDSPDVCTDPRCFAQKQDAHWQNVSKDHALLHGKDAVVKKSADAARYLQYDSGYVDLEGRCHEANGSDYGKTWRQLMNGFEEGLHPVLVRNPETGAIATMVPLTVARKTLKTARSASGKAAEDPQALQERKRREKAKREQAFREALLRRLFAEMPPGSAMQPPGVTSEDLVTIAHQMFLATSTNSEVVGRIALEASTGEPATPAQLKAHDPRDPEAFAEAIRDLNDAKVMRLMLVMAVVGDSAVSPWSLDRKPELLTAVCKRYGMSIDALRESWADQGLHPARAKAKPKQKGRPA
jgi:ParB/RepB/Spo0J family partition protein